LPSSISQTLSSQFAGVAESSPDFAQITVRVDDDGKATLDGRVRSNATRELAEILVRLEPGVRSVQNDVIVASAEN